MTIVDALLVALGLGASGGAWAWADHRGRLGWLDWLGGSVLAVIGVNVLMWRLHDWDLRGAAVLSVMVTLLVGLTILRWNSPYAAADIDAERRRAHYRNYPFNQWKPKDVDEPDV